MDCDTTGVEPDFALVKSKKLAGGGYFKIVNTSVPVALARLGYSKKQQHDIVAYIVGTFKLEGTPNINAHTLREKGFSDADIEKAVPVAAMSVFANSGQICIAGSRLFVAREIHDEFVRRVADFAANLKIGHGIAGDTDIGPIISARQSERIEMFLQAGPSEGAEVITGGEKLSGEGFDGGHFIRPTVFGGVKDDMRIAREEIFGPVISALPFDSIDEVVARANDTPYGLAAGVFTTHLGTAHKMAHRLKAGSVWVNMYHAIDPVVPFGGLKMSGYGKEGGLEHMDAYLDTKAVWINTD